MNEVLMKTKEDIERGVLDALLEIRPSLAMHGGDAQLVKIENGVVELKLEGSCHGCPMSVITFGMALKDMLQEKFPNEINNVVWNGSEDAAACCDHESTEIK